MNPNASIPNLKSILYSTELLLNLLPELRASSIAISCIPGILIKVLFVSLTIECIWGVLIIYCFCYYIVKQKCLTRVKTKREILRRKKAKIPPNSLGITYSAVVINAEYEASTTCLITLDIFRILIICYFHSACKM